MRGLRLLTVGMCALLVLTGSYVFAQGLGATTGTMQGVVTDNAAAALPGVLVTVSGAAGMKSATTDADGKFIFPYLTPGVYNVRAELTGFTTIEQSDIEVRLGQRVEITFKLNPGKEELVVVTGEAPTVDVSSTTTGASLSGKLLETIPVGRSFASALSLAPGVTDAGVGGGNMSISGASGLENTYVIDGVNITDPGYGAVGSYSIVFGSLGSGFNQDMVKEIQVKSGGFEPEYGQALGGVVNVITKSGGNEYSGQGYAYLSPAAIEGDYKPIVSNSLLVVNIKEDQSIDGGLDIGGPVLKDRLFFYGAYNPKKVDRTFVNDPAAPLFSQYPETTRTRISQAYNAKLTGNVSANHTVEFSAFGDPSKGKMGFQRASGIAALEPVARMSELQYGSNSQIGRWTGILRSNMFAEASVARARSTFKEVFGPEGNQYQFSDRRTTPYIASGGVGYFDADEIGTNMQYGVKMTNIWKGHEIRYGLQFEDIDYSGGRDYTGPLYTAFNGQQTTTGASVRIQPVTAGACSRYPGLCGLDRYYYVVRNTLSPVPVPTATAYLNWFAQDSWNITSYLNAKFGVRWEQQQLKGTNEGANDIKLSNNWAPRLGVTYDYLKNGKSKAFFHYGRFFEKIPNDLAVRALNAEISSIGFYYDAALSRPVIGSGVLSGLNPTTVEGLGNWNTVWAGTSMVNSPYKAKSQYSDEFIGGVEQEIQPGFSLGGRYIYRKVARVLEDVQIDLTSPCVPYASQDSSVCVPPGMVADEGFWLSNTSAYFITNMDGHYPGFPAMKRNYNAFELTFEKRMSSNWQLMGSYRYATLKGNYEGLFRRDNGQSDPNVTSLGDFAQCHANPDGSCTVSPFIGFTFAEGPLPNDQKHVVKLYATYAFNMGLNAGAGVNYNTGNPMQELGAIPWYGSEERLLGPRGSLGRTPAITTVDVHADYGLKLGMGKMVLGLDVFNLFQAQSALTYDLTSQQDDRSFQPPANPDYRLVTEYQLPRTVRFLVKYTF